jgi:hypothetical protein
MLAYFRVCPHADSNCHLQLAYNLYFLLEINFYTFFFFAENLLDAMKQVSAVNGTLLVLQAYFTVLRDSFSLFFFILPGH